MRPAKRDRAKPASGRPRKPPTPKRYRTKMVVAIASVLVLGLTGFAYIRATDIRNSFTTADVIDSGAGGEKPPDGAVDIVLVGLDSRTDAQGKPLPKELLAKLNAGKSDGVLNTDTIILMRIPNDGSRAVGVSMPRDSYITIPGYGKHKINSAYMRGKLTERQNLIADGVTDQSELEVRSNQAGAKVLISTVQQLTGATIDHYAEVNLLGFHDITEAIGGIEVCLNDDVDDDFSGAHFPAGNQVLAGAPALAFVRQRHGLPRGDLDRIVRQQVFMKGLATKVLAADMLTDEDKLSNLQDAVSKSVVLDKDWDVFDFAKSMQEATGGNLDFKTIPVGDLNLDTDEGEAIEVNPEVVKSFVRSLLGGAAPPGTDPGAGGRDPGNSAITVDVRNAAGVAGLATKVAHKLIARGFTPGQTGNADVRDLSVVRYAKGEKASADKVAEALGGMQVEPDSNIPAGHVTVMLGEDYQDAPSRFAGQGPLRLDGGGPFPRQDPPPPPSAPGGLPCIN